MSDSTGQGGTQPLTPSTEHHDVDDLRLDPSDERATRPATGGDTAGSRTTSDPVTAIKDPDNRAKLLLGIGVLTLLNFLLLLGVLASVMDGHDQVIVDGTPCIIDEREGEAVLFCQR